MQSSHYCCANTFVISPWHRHGSGCTPKMSINIFQHLENCVCGSPCFYLPQLNNIYNLSVLTQFLTIHYLYLNKWHLQPLDAFSELFLHPKCICGHDCPEPWWESLQNSPSLTELTSLGLWPRTLALWASEVHHKANSWLRHCDKLCRCVAISVS